MPLFPTAAPLSQGLRFAASMRGTSATTATLCTQCRRSLMTSATMRSGHNKWSKIKHTKGAADKKKSTQRAAMARQMMVLSRFYGADMTFNSQLATLVALAKKTGMPKAIIDSAIARGQGNSPTGQKLEKITLEAMVTIKDADGSAGDAISLIIDLETDSKLRAVQDIRQILKKNSAVQTPTVFSFSRVGRTVFLRKGGNSKDAAENSTAEAELDEILMQALEAGAEDVDTTAIPEDEDGAGGHEITVFSPATQIHAVAQKISATFPALEVQSSAIVYIPSGDPDLFPAVGDARAAQSLSAFLAELRDYPDTQGVYANVRRGDALADEELWEGIEEHLDS